MKRAGQIIAASAMILVTGLASAHEAGEWVLRAGVGQVAPKSGNLNIGSIDLGGGVSLDSASIEVDDGTSLVLSATYMFTDNWALDILAAAPFKHDIDVKASITAGGDTVAGSVPIGDTSHLPPTVSVQYHFSPGGQFQPYAGLGVNWTTFFDEGLTDDAIAVGFEDLSLSSSFGVAAQVGADWMLGDRWLVNLDLRWINIESDVKVTLDDGSGPFTGELGTVEIDPWVYQLNVGYRF